MKRPLFVAFALALGLSLGCAPRAWTPASMSVASSYQGERHYQSDRAPADRVYHDGRWLTYRGDGYYYNDGGRWVLSPYGAYPYYGRRGYYGRRYGHQPGWGRPAPTQPSDSREGYTIHRR